MTRTIGTVIYKLPWLTVHPEGLARTPRVSAEHLLACSRCVKKLEYGLDYWWRGSLADVHVYNERGDRLAGLS